MKPSTTVLLDGRLDRMTVSIRTLLQFGKSSTGKAPQDVEVCWQLAPNTRYVADVVVVGGTMNLRAAVA